MLKLTLFLPLLALVAAGQSPLADWEKVRMLTPGTGVRVIDESAKAALGSLESVGESNLVINAISSRQTFERARIISVAVKQDGHRVRNTFVGLGAGLAGGFAVGAAIGHGCTGFLCGPVSVIGGVAVGMVGGTVTGLVWPTGGWRKIYQR